ncbi:MAG: hypothetical protein QNJ12_21665, partial [Ilumatobacter sp.]|nr:hypothetical protein [Ilumatobacter sp.]
MTDIAVDDSTPPSLPDPQAMPAPALPAPDMAAPAAPAAPAPDAPAMPAPGPAEPALPTLSVAPDAPAAAPAPAQRLDLMLDGEAPRLATAPIAAPAPVAQPEAPAAPTPVALDDDAPSLPQVAPELPDTASEPVVEQSAPVGEGPEIDPTTLSEPAEPRHPMAHLMPEKSAPSESQLRAAAIRAERKAKSRKIKIGVAAGALVVGAVAGPPLVSWLTDAINEAGNVSTESE